MKPSLSILLLILTYTSSFSQILTPVKWKHTVTKTANNTLKITFTGTIEPGWYVYAQVQPAKAIAQPLQLTFNKNPSVALVGKPREIGKMVRAVDQTTGIEDHHYSTLLEVVQLVKVNTNKKTTLSGVLTFQTCNSERCLPPEDVEFSLALNR